MNERMKRESAWALFEKSGTVEAYLLYCAAHRDAKNAELR